MDDDTESPDDSTSDQNIFDDTSTVRDYEIVPQKSLFLLLKNLQHTERMIADNWIIWYRDNRQEAISELLQLFVSTLGYDHLISLPNNIARYHVAFQTHIRIMEYKFKQEQDYLFGNDTMQLYRQKYCNVLKKIVNLGRNDIVYDDVFMETIADFLKSLNQSRLVEHQHLSIITALSFFTPLTRLESNLLSVSIEERDLEKILDVQDMMKDLYNGIIGKYMISECDDIYQACFQSLRKWIVYNNFGQNFQTSLVDRNNMEFFLNILIYLMSPRYCSEPHLSHLLVATTHAERSMRLQAVNVLLQFYKSCAESKIPNEDERMEHLEEFSRLHRNILIGLCHKDIPRVCCSGFEIIKIIHRIFPDVLEHNDIQLLCRLVFVSSQQVARAAGSFLWQHITREHPGRRIQSLMVFYTSYKPVTCDMGTLMDALYLQITKEVFQEIIDLLDKMLHTVFYLMNYEQPDITASIEEDVIFHEEVSELFTETLIDMLLNYARLATTGVVKRERHKRKVLSDLELLDIKLKRAEMTAILLQRLPEYLESVIDVNERCVAMMLEIPRHLNLQDYRGNDELTRELLQNLIRCARLFDDRDVLEECIHTLCEYRSLEETDIGDTSIVVTELDVYLVSYFEKFQELWGIVRETNMDDISVIERILVDPEFELQKYTSIVLSLLRYLPLDCDEQFDSIINLLVINITREEAESIRSPESLLFWIDCQRILYYYVMRQLESVIPDSETIDAATWRELDHVNNIRLREFLGLLFRTMASTNIQWELRILSFEQLCDLLIMCKYISEHSRTECVILNEFSRQLGGFWSFMELVLLDEAEDLTIVQKSRSLIFYFQLIWKRIIPYESSKIVLRHHRKYQGLGKSVGEMVKCLKDIEKYNPHVKIKAMVFS